MSKAIALGSASFMAFYCHGALLLRDLSDTEESTKNARLALENAARLNPMYAPTFEALTQVYSRWAETQPKRWRPRRPRCDWIRSRGRTRRIWRMCC